MPGLSLTRDQVERLCGIERAACQLVLDTLIARKFLRLNAAGRYVRLTEGHSSQLSPALAKADIKIESRPQRAS